MIVCDAEISCAGLLRLGLRRFINGQTLNDHIKGQAVLVSRINGGDFRFLGNGLFRLLNEQVGIAFILAECFLEEVPADCLIAPGIGAGVNEDIMLPDMADGPAYIVVAVLEGNFVPLLIREFALQMDRPTLRSPRSGPLLET